MQVQHGVLRGVFGLDRVGEETQAQAKHHGVVRAVPRVERASLPGDNRADAVTLLANTHFGEAQRAELTVGFTPDAYTPALRGFTVTVAASAELSVGAIGDEDPFHFAHGRSLADPSAGTMNLFATSIRL